MIKYRTGGSILIFIILLFPMIIPMVFLIQLFKQGGFSDGGPQVFIISIFFFIWYIINISAFIQNILCMKRKSIALKGHRGKGIVKNNYISHSKNTSFCNIEIEHQTDSGETVLMQTEVQTDESLYFPIGKEIPLYINGNYAYFKLDELSVDNNYNLNEQENENKEKEDSCCPYCGSKVNPSSRICPNCRANLL